MLTCQLTSFFTNMINLKLKLKFNDNEFYYGANAIG